MRLKAESLRGGAWRAAGPLCFVPTGSWAVHDQSDGIQNVTAQDTPRILEENELPPERTVVESNLGQDGTKGNTPPTVLESFQFVGLVRYLLKTQTATVLDWQQGDVRAVIQEKRNARDRDLFLEVADLNKCNGGGGSKRS